MNNPINYTHENYREVMKEARIYDGTNSCYFCPDCRRYIPKKESEDPCVICGSTQWNLDSPLRQKIIDTKVLKQYMFETFKNIIEPFTTFNTQEWKNGNFFYRKDTTERKIKEDKEHLIKDIELWSVSHRGLSAFWFLSLCCRWKEVFIYSDGKISENTYLKYFTFKSPELFYDYNDEKNDEFYLSLIFDEIVSTRCRPSQLCFKTRDESNNDKDTYAYIINCCESMHLYPDEMIGSLYAEQLAKGDFTHLMTALDDFTLIPRYWGSEY